MNALSLSAASHMRFTENPVEFTRWLEAYVGHGFLDILAEKKNEKVKISNVEEKEIAQHYREELKRMQEQRAQGTVGRIEFESYA